ncbi:MAG: hypothetical protein EAZ55_00145 [Cytophagales bacterium]|nr:MAG: hypothetical protein EAZ55_00145 [Cytophagales bacterium]
MNKYIVFIIGLFLFAFQSCRLASTDDEELAEAIRLNEKEIQAYISTNRLQTQKTASGLYYAITATSNSSRTVSTGEQVTMKYTTKLLNGALLDTFYRNTPRKYPHNAGTFVPGLEEGVSLLKVGEKAIFLIPSNLAFGNNLIESNTGINIPPNSVLIYEVEIIAFKSEDEQIQEYIAANNISGAKKQNSGLYYVETLTGTGQAATKDSTMVVYYTGKTLDGKIFDRNITSPGFSFRLGLESGQGSVIKGWNEGFLLMKEKGKAILLIPSSLAYGSSGTGNLIPPYTPLLFEVELLEIKQ